MITIAEAETMVEKLADRFLRKKTFMLLEAAGLVMAESVAATEPSPAATNSAMDGIAVRWNDVAETSEASPVILPLRGESRAGVPCDHVLEANTAVRISTGGVLPESADTVVPLEDLSFEKDGVSILKVSKKGANVRLRGAEFKAGDCLLEAGTELSPPVVALLASQGIISVKAFAPLVVSILTTGEEIVPVGAKRLPHQVRNSNAILLSTAVVEAGARIFMQKHLPDDSDATFAGIVEASGKSSLVILSGGVSVGPHDHVKQAALRAGFNQVFWCVWQKPGKPLFLAEKKDCILFGLPGNPAATYLCFLHYVRPLIRRSQGRAFTRPVVSACLAAPQRSGTDRTLMVRASLHKEECRLVATPLAAQESNMITSLSAADGYFLLEPGQALEAGQEVPFCLFPGSALPWEG